MFKVLIVEDDNNIRKLIASVLQKEGYTADEAADGVKGLERFEASRYDIIITDIMMPNMDGNELVKHIRQLNKDVPVLMLTAKDTLTDKREGFHSGADDYITKPFCVDEMLLRISALLRRSKIVTEKQLVIGDVFVDYNNNIVRKGNFEIELPKKEFLLLYKLLSSPNRIFTRMEIMDDIWGYDTSSDDRTIDVHIRRIREKLESITEFEINTVRGLGYKAIYKV